MERMKETTLTRRLMTRFVICMAILMVLAIPLLYLITTNYYVEDLAELVRQYEITNPDIDLERDTIEGLLIQFFAIIAIILTHCRAGHHALCAATPVASVQLHFA